VDASIDEPHLNVSNAGVDNYLLSYNAANTNFTWVPATAGGTLNAIYEETVAEGDADIVSLDFDAPFSVVEAPDTYVTIDIEDDGINSQHYAAGSIDLEHMSANSVDSDQYVDGSIDLIHMSVNSIDSDQYVDGSIDLIHMSVNSVDSDQYVDGSIDTAHIAADQIDSTLIADNAIDSEHYTDGSIDEIHLNISNAPQDEWVLTYETDTTSFQWVSIAAGGSMNAVELSDSQVGGSDIVTLDFTSVFGVTEAPDTEINIDIADDGIDSEHYNTGSIDTEHIAADQIDSTLIVDNAINSEHYTDGSIDEIHLNIDNAPTDEYVLTYESDTGNFAWQVDAGGANLGVYDGGVQVGGTDIDKLDFDGTVFAVTEPVDTDILIDIDDDGIDSQHYNADSIDNEHINWADIDNLNDEGAVSNLGSNVTVGNNTSAPLLDSTGNITIQLGDAAGTNIFEIEDSGGIEVFQVDSNGVLNPSSTPNFKLYDNDTSTYPLYIDADVVAGNDSTVDFSVLINNVKKEM
jgi:hypothetical protein